MVITYKVPNVLIWHGKRVISGSKICEYGFPYFNLQIAQNLKLEEGVHYYRLHGDTVAEFIYKNKKSLESMYSNSKATLTRLYNTCYYIVTLNGLEKINEIQSYRHLGKTIEWLKANYFHVIPTNPEELKDVWDNLEKLTEKGGETMKATELLSELSKGIQELNRMEESAMKQLQEIKAEKQAIKNQLKTILQEAE